jgi:hypothetical protein
MSARKISGPHAVQDHGIDAMAAITPGDGGAGDDALSDPEIHIAHFGLEAMRGEARALQGGDRLADLAQQLRLPKHMRLGARRRQQAQRFHASGRGEHSASLQPPYERGKDPLSHVGQGESSRGRGEPRSDFQRPLHRLDPLTTLGDGRDHRDTELVDELGNIDHQPVFLRHIELVERNDDGDAHSIT